MHSSGYDHGRNLLIAGAFMCVVARAPPQRLMTFAVSL